MMEKRILVILAVLVQSLLAFAQTDSIVTFANLSFRNAFEKKAFTDFTLYRKDTLNAFLVTDEMVGREDAAVLNDRFENIWKELLSRKIANKKTNAQIDLVFLTVKKHCFIKYVQEETFSSTLLYGRYNEVTAVALLSMFFDRLHIPYSILDASNKIYLIANPGKNEQRLDIPNPSPIGVVSVDDKKARVDFWRQIGSINDAYFSSHTVEEIYDAKCKEERPITVKELLGNAYFHLAAKRNEMNEFNDAVCLAQKAYYLYPNADHQFLLFITLANKLNSLTIKRVTDIDYLVQCHRAGNTKVQAVNESFKTIIQNQMEFTDGLPLCDSLYHRFLSQINDQELIDELTFTYSLLKINQRNPSYPDILLVDNAVCIKSNIRDLNNLLEWMVNLQLMKITDEKERMDSLQSLSRQLKSKPSKNILESQRLTILLALAKTAYKEKKPDQGEKYLSEFETTCPRPVENRQLLWSIESSYREIAVALYWAKNQDYVANNKMVQRGLRFAPDSKTILSGMYDKSLKYDAVGTASVTKQKTDPKAKTTGRTLRVVSKGKKDKVYTF